MAAPMRRMFPSWASHFSSVFDQIKEAVDPRKDVLQIRCPLDSSKILMIGLHGSGKTALLFQYALSCAMDGHRVVFVTQKKLDSMPLFVDGAPKPDPMLMKQVQIMYFDERESLLSYLAGIHTEAGSATIDALIVDNLDYYVTHPKSPDHTATIGTICAFLVDAATFITDQRSKSSGDASSSDVQHDCQILASVSVPNPGEFSMESFYTYFLPTIIRIQSVKDQDNLFQLYLQQNGSSHRDQTITYEIKECIRLLDISSRSGLLPDSVGD